MQKKKKRSEIRSYHYRYPPLILINPKSWQFCLRKCVIKNFLQIPFFSFRQNLAEGVGVTVVIWSDTHTHLVPDECKGCPYLKNFLISFWGRNMYGGTHTLAEYLLPYFGIESRFFDPEDPESIADLKDERTRLVYAEYCSNPSKKFFLTYS